MISPHSTLFKKDAFSLIELILVLVLISIFFSIAVPRVSGTLGMVSLKSCARSLIATLNLAHLSAVHNGINYRVNYDLDRDAYWVTVESEPSVYSPVTERWGSMQTLSHGIKLRDITTVRNSELSHGTEYTNFTPSGRGEKCVLHMLNDKGEVFTIMVSRALGKARVLAYDFKVAP